MNSRPIVPPERITGRSPASSALIVPGTSREKLKSPPPNTFAKRVTATGSPKVLA